MKLSKNYVLISANIFNFSKVKTPSIYKPYFQGLLFPFFKKFFKKKIAPSYLDIQSILNIKEITMLC